MKITNKFNIPQTFMNVLDRPTYSKGKAHLSVTQLLNSPKIVALTKKFEDEIEQDASDMVWSIFGSAVHNILEHGKDEEHIVEERLHKEYDGWHISGAIDLQILNPDGIDVKDYKTTSAWAVMNEKIDWENQLNMYAGLVEDVKQVPVTSVGIVAIIRDWSRREAGTREGYPEAPVKEIPIRLWTKEERNAYISSRVALHSACDFALETDGALPDCTPAEMWEKPNVWAVRKIGGKRAHSLYETEDLANAALTELGKAYEIEVRQGERTRCGNFCPVSTWCNQYQTYLKEQA
jgi:hypothetical protein